jgi:tetratricopeptide (TPR) repeat protein
MLAAWFTCASCGPATSPEESPEFAAAMNRGKALLENRDGALAVAAFREAVEIAPDSPTALRNLARAYLLDRDMEPLASVLERARALEPESIATHYLTGLADSRLGRFEEAIAHLEEVARLDPHTAAVRFQLAHAYQGLGRHEEAREQLLETLKLDPFHAAAHYRLAGYARRAGDREALASRLRELERLRVLFGEQSRSAETLEACLYTLAETPAAAVAGADRRAGAWSDAVRFRDATREMLAAEMARVVAASVLEVDERGRYTLFTADADGAASLLVPDAGGALRRDALDLQLSEAVLASDRLVSLTGSFRAGDPEGRRAEATPQVGSDLLLLGDGGAQLLERVGPAAFEDVTASAGLSGARGNAARWVDYEHDGDLDLLVAGETGLSLWQNGGDGRFEEVSHSVGIDESEPAWDVAVGDLDNDVAVDLVAARGARATRVFDNQRAGHFAPQPEPPGPWPAARRVLVDDLDNDGHLDALLIGAERAQVVLGRGGERPQIDLGGIEGHAAALIDLDNDGWLDLLVAGTAPGAEPSGRLALWRNGGADGWLDVSAATGIAAVEVAIPRHVVAADLDGDGDSDLLLVTATGLRVLRNDGGDANGQLKVRLVGTKTNPSGIGTRVEVRAETFQAVRSISSAPIEIGLGARRKVDSVQTVWTNGVVENAIQVAVAAEPLTIVERVVAAGSCPFLYAWDGQRFRFVTDILGNSPIGLSLRRGEFLPADPDELVQIGAGGDLVARDGDYVLQVTDEMREVLYLDAARLVAADHLPEVEVHTTDQLQLAPFRPSELWPVHAPRLARSAVGDDGIDRTRELRAIDGDFAPAGTPLPPPLRGMTHPLAIALDFGPLDDLRAPVLVLTGWLQYGDASTNIAASQNQSLTMIPITLEMEAADGTWHTVDATIGQPAGKTKTIAVDLTGELVPGTRRLRLISSFELRWDRIALFERLPESAVEIREVRPAAADLQWRGFSEIRQRAPRHPTTPDWDVVFERPPWRTTLEGWVTRYGDVLELVAEPDGALAILNGGDALELRFPASELPPPAPGHVRTFFFYSLGWDKDGDYNVVGGDRVAPLPVVAGADGDWRIRYNTRWVPKHWSAREP